MAKLIKLQFKAQKNYRQHHDGNFKGDNIWRDGDVRNVDENIAKKLLRDYPLVFSTVQAKREPVPKPMDKQPHKEVTANKPKGQVAK